MKDYTDNYTGGGGSVVENVGNNVEFFDAGSRSRFILIFVVIDVNTFTTVMGSGTPGSMVLHVSIGNIVGVHLALAEIRVVLLEEFPCQSSSNC
jgi:hypothetical protein